VKNIWVIAFIIFSFTIVKGQQAANPTNLLIVSNIQGSVELGWDDNSLNENGFKIYRSKSNVFFEEIASIPANIAQYQDVTVAGNTDYYYFVSAYVVPALQSNSDTIHVKSINNPPSLDIISDITAKETALKEVAVTFSNSDFKSLDNYRIVVLGSSTSEGILGTSDYSQSWVGLLTSWINENYSNTTVFNLAKRGYNTRHIRPDGSNPIPDSERNISMAISLNPDLILINMPSNNVAANIPITTTMDHYREILGLANQAGIPILLTTTQPRDFTDSDTIKRHLLEEEADSVRRNFKNLVIDIYDELTDFQNDNRIKAEYRYTDGVHLVDAGHAYIFSEVKAKMTSFIPLEVLNITLSNEPDFVSLNDINNFGSLNIVIDAQVSDARSYPNIVLQLSDNNGGITSAAFNLEIKDYEYIFSPSDVIANNITHYSSVVQWDDNSENESAFEVFRSIGDNTSYVKIGEVGSNTLLYTDLLLSPDSDVYYKIRAKNSTHFSEYSEELMISTLQSPVYTNSLGDDASDPNQWEDEFGSTLQNFSEPYITYALDNDVILLNDWQIPGQGSNILILGGLINVDLNGYDLMAPRLELGRNGTLEFVSSPGSNISINREIVINNGSSVTLNENVLSLEGEAVINEFGETGNIKSSGGRIVFDTNTPTESNLYFDEVENQLSELSFRNQGTGKVQIRSSVNISNALELQSGILSTNNFVTLKSDELNTARIRRVGSGANVEGDIIWERYIGQAKTSGWYNFTTGLHNVSVSQLSDDMRLDGVWNGKYPSIRTYNESLDKWQSYISDATVLTPGDGSQVFMFSEDLTTGNNTLDFQGAPVLGDGQGNNDGEYRIPLTKNGSWDGGGWNLVGNPYICEIDWESSIGWDKTYIANSYYVWDGTTKGYKAFVDGVGTGGLDGIIPSGQAFFVKVDDAQYTNQIGLYLGLTEDVKSQTESNPSFLRKSKGENDKELIHIVAGSLEGGYTDDCYIRFHKGGTKEFDQSYDAYKFDGDNLNVSTTTIGGINLAINTLPRLINGMEIKIDFRAREAGQYKLDFDGREIGETVIGRGIGNLFLVDKKLNKRIDLSQTRTYTFTFDEESTTDVEQRFVLVYNGNHYSKVNKAELISWIKVYPNPFRDYIRFMIKMDEAAQLRIEIYNAQGQIITHHEEYLPFGYNLVDVNGAQSEASFDNLPNGMYFYKLVFDNAIAKGVLIKRNGSILIDE
jgi:lysophospholipase L1-like esterase